MKRLKALINNILTTTPDLKVGAIDFQTITKNYILKYKKKKTKLNFYQFENFNFVIKNNFNVVNT